MFKAGTNPFLDPDFSKLMDPSKMMSDYKIPGFDIGALMEAHRKNMEAMQTGNQAALEGLQVFAQRQADLMRQSMEATTAMMRAITSSASAIGAASTPTEPLKTAS